MRQPVETGRRENLYAPERLERVLLVRTHLRGRHYGQRSCEPHQQVEHMAAPTRLSRTSNQSLPTESRPHMALSGNPAIPAGCVRRVDAGAVDGVAIVAVADQADEPPEEPME